MQENSRQLQGAVPYWRRHWRIRRRAPQFALRRQTIRRFPRLGSLVQESSARGIPTIFWCWDEIFSKWSPVMGLIHSTLYWSQMSKYGKPNIVATSEATKFTKLPVNEGEEVQVSQDAAYFHYCANETVHGLHHSPISPFLVFPFSFRFLM